MTKPELNRKLTQIIYDLSLMNSDLKLHLGPDMDQWLTDTYGCVVLNITAIKLKLEFERS